MFNRLLFFILSLFLFFSCSDKKGSGIVYKKAEDEKLDATATWLNAKENFHKKNYNTLFYNYYKTKISEQKYEDAATILEIVSIKKIHFFTYDSLFTKTIHSFSEKYSGNLTPKKSTFIHSYLGNYESDSGNFKKAINHFNEVIKIQETDYYSCINKAYAYFDISFCYFSIGNQNLAMENSLKALTYFNKTDNLIGKGAVYSNMASINLATKNYKLSNEYYDKAIQNFRLAKDTTNIFISYFNKIQNFEESNNKNVYNLIDSTYHLFNESKFKDRSLKISIHTCYTTKLLHNNKIDEAKKVLDDLKKDVEIIQSSMSQVEYDVAVAEYEIKKKSGNLNVDRIKKLIPNLNENQDFQHLKVFYSTLKDVAKANNNYSEALFYVEELNKVSDSLASNLMKIKTTELETKYQTQEKQQQIVLQKTEILNKNTTIALLASFFIGLFLTVVVYITRQKQKKLKLEKENVQQYTKQLLEKTEEERKRIASDLHDSVSHELLSLKNSFEEKNDITNNKIDAIINDIRIISRNLHPILFDKIGLKASVEQLVERAQSVNDFMVTAEIDYTNVLSKNDELQLYRIIQEALSNIIKYANAIAAKITIQQKNNNLLIEIKDNGKGFNINEKLNGKNAFGLHNIIERSRAIGGEAKIVSDTNGTIITIEIKKQ
jgi:two-component system, NarL family, sensor kinase